MRYLSSGNTSQEFNRLKAWFLNHIGERKSKVTALEGQIGRQHGNRFNRLPEEVRNEYQEAVVQFIKQCAVDFEHDFGVEVRGTWTINLATGWSGNVTVKLGDNDFFHDHGEHMHIKEVNVYSLFLQRWKDGVLGNPSG